MNFMGDVSPFIVEVHFCHGPRDSFVSDFGFGEIHFSLPWAVEVYVNCLARQVSQRHPGDPPTCFLGTASSLRQKLLRELEHHAPQQLPLIDIIAAG